jgi:hypothetical protein
MPTRLAIALTVVCALHCGGDVIIPLPGDAGTPADTLLAGDSVVDATPDTADAAGAVVAAFCGNWQRCSPVSFNGMFASMNDCLAFVASTEGNEVSLPGLTPDELTAIIDQDNTEACKAYTPSHPTGTLPNGSSCQLGVQCASGECDTGNGTCGTCTGGAAGSACATNLDCAVPTVCVYGVCGAPQPNGATCVDGNYTQCQSGYCARGVGAGLQPGVSVCQDNPSAGAGASCLATYECALGLVCNRAGVCAQPVYVATGQPCTLDSICIGGYCDSTFTVCTAYTAPGSPCTANTQCRTSCMYVGSGGDTGVCDIPFVTTCN